MTEPAGVLVIDKSPGMTSHDVVVVVRRILSMQQVGHFGTLDPFATGVLPVSIGKATRFAQFYLKSRKSYEGTLSFRFSTDTYDATGRPTSLAQDLKLDLGLLEKTLEGFTGRILQTPPAFSAKRVGGVRAYQLARNNRPVELQPVEVDVYSLELSGIKGPEVQFSVECSGGTYVRSLAHDLGQKIGLPSHLVELRRVGVAEFEMKNSITLDELGCIAKQGQLAKALIPPRILLPGCPELVVRGREEKNIRHGHSFELTEGPDMCQSTQGSPAAPILKILNPERQLIAVARHVAGSVYHPNFVLS